MKIIKKILLAFFSIFRIKNVIVFESYADFSDNSRALFEYLIKEKYNNKYKIYWFVGDAKKFSDIKIKNVKFIKVWTNINQHTILEWLKMFMITKNAKVIFFSNRTVHRINKKTIWIHLNHGTPFKRVKDLKVVPRDVDYLISSSPKCSQIYHEQLGLSLKQLLETGNPRNDILFSTDKVKVLKKVFRNKKYSRVILWLPTFRKQKNTNRIDSTKDYPYGVPLIYNEKDLLKLNKLLKDNNSILVLKLHPVQDTSMLKSVNLTNIVLLTDGDLIDADLSLTELYVGSDALITDYSGLYYDYLLVDKMIGFAIDDFDEYQKQKGFVFDNPLEYMAGLKMYNYDDLETFVIQCVKRQDNFKVKRRELSKEFNTYSDCNSSKRIVEFLNL